MQVLLPLVAVYAAAGWNSTSGVFKPVAMVRSVSSQEDSSSKTRDIENFNLIQTLKQCGDDLTRENVMRQAANLKDLELPMLLPGIKINTSPTDFFPIEQEQLVKFDGKRWVPFGGILTGH